MSRIIIGQENELRDHLAAPLIDAIEELQFPFEWPTQSMQGLPYFETIIDAMSQATNTFVGLLDRRKLLTKANLICAIPYFSVSGDCFYKKVKCEKGNSPFVWAHCVF